MRSHHLPLSLLARWSREVLENPPPAAASFLTGPEKIFASLGVPRERRWGQGWDPDAEHWARGSSHTQPGTGRPELPRGAFAQPRPISPWH